MLGVEERHSRRMVRIQSVQLEGPFAGMNCQVAAPVHVEVVEVQQGDDLGLCRLFHPTDRSAGLSRFFRGEALHSSPWAFHPASFRKG